MYIAFYLSLLLILVPIQVTVLNHVSPWGVRPDLCLVATCLMGFLGGKNKGMGLGVGLGFIQDLFSGGAGIVNLLTKGMIGFLSGLVSRTLSSTTPQAIFLPTLFLSSLCGVIALFSSRPHTDWLVLTHEFRTILLPQSLFDALLTVGVYWLLGKWRLVTSSVESSGFR